MSLLTSLSAYYKLDGNPNASFGSNNGANGVGVVYGSGIINQGLVCSGSNSYIGIPDSSDFTFGNTDFGISFWFKRNTLGTQQWIMGQIAGSGYNTTGSIIMQFTAANKLQIDNFSLSFDTVVLDPLAITDTNWHHCVYTRSGTIFYLYIDNVLRVSVDTVTPYSLNDVPYQFSIGKAGEYFGSTFVGSLDEVGFWKQSLLPYVSALYNAGAGLTYPFDTSVGPINYLMVGGGAQGGSAYGGVGGGGGGAGGLLTGATSLVLGTYPIVIGAGGVGLGNAISINGGNTTFNSLTAIGGSRGRSYGDTLFTGGSGGGGNGWVTYSIANPGTPGQGSYGGNGKAGSPYNGGGGGGAGGTGFLTVGINGGNGGAGILSSISGTAQYYAGGGGGSGGQFGSGGLGGLGGSGIGGNGGVSTSSLNAIGLPGVVNTGSGGGGSAAYSNGYGGYGSDGVVILSYTTGSLNALGGTVTTAGGNTIHTFTTNDNFIIYGSNANFLTMFDN